MGTPSKLGLNILAGGSYNELRLLSVLDALNPTALVCMNNSDLALRLADRYPNTLIIYRHWPDGKLWESWSPEIWLNTMISYVPDSRIAIYVGNEPHPEDYAAHVAFTLAVIAEAKRLKRRIVVGNYGMGGPEDSDLHGILFPVLKAAANFPEIVLYGTHEYADYHDYKYSGPGWDGRPHVDFNPHTGNNWLIGRFQRIRAVATSRGLPSPKFIITEHGFDSLHSAFHGWNTEKSPVSPEFYAGQLIEMDSSIYSQDDDVLGTCIFSWGDENWPTFDIQNALPLQYLLIQYVTSKENSMIETKRMRVSVKENLRRRKNPAGELVQNNSLVAGVRDMDVSTEFVDVAFPGGRIVYRWRFFAEVNENSGYWSATGTTTEPEAFVEIIPPDVPEPEPEPESLKGVYEKILHGATLYQQLMLSIANQATLAAGYTQEYIDDIQNIINGDD